MDANTMRARFMLHYEGARLGNRTFNDREISDFFNKAQLQIIKQRFDALKNRTQRGFESGNIRDAELAGIITATHSIPYTSFLQGTADNGALRNPDLDNTGSSQDASHYGVFATKPDECLYLINEVCTTADSLPTATTIKYNVPVEGTDYGEYISRIWDPYAKPYANLVWAMNWGSYTTSTFDPSTGNFTDSTKTNTTDATGYNMTGYFQSSGDLTNTDGTQLTSGSQEIVEGNYYIVRGTTGGANYITYNGTKLPGVIFAGTSTDDFTATGDAELWDITVNINARRSRYLLTGKNWVAKDYVVHYIKNPKEIVVDVITPSNQVSCELAEFLHQEIVDLAVKVASASIVPEQGKYQVNDNESRVNE